jgi:hypothetical protein
MRPIGILLLLPYVLAACARPARAPLRADAPRGSLAPAPAPVAAPEPAPVTVTPAVAPPPAPAEAEYLVFAIGEPLRDYSITSAAVDPKEAKRVRTALFPKQLSDLADCPRPFFEPQTWIEVDRLQGDNIRAGRFVAVVEQRFEGSFTAPGQDELLFVVRIDNCQSNTSTSREYAIFASLSRKPILRWGDLSSNFAGPRFLAAIQDQGQPVRFLERSDDGYRLVEMNRPFVPGAPFRNSTEYFTTDGQAVVEPWSLVASWAPPRPTECRGFYRRVKSPALLRFAQKPGRCR